MTDRPLMMRMHSLSVALLGLAIVTVALCRNVYAETATVTLGQVQKGNTVSLYAELHDCTKATVTVFAALDNTDSSVPFPVTADLAGPGRKIIVTLKQRDSKLPWEFRTRFEWHYGNRLFKKPTRFSGESPVRDGPLVVLRGPHEPSLHGVHTDNAESIDWQVPVGTKIYPARAGAVLTLHHKVDSKIGRDYIYLALLHEDGTLTEYYPLKTGSVPLHLGQQVSPNETIGSSSKVDSTSKPYLHFGAFYPLDGLFRKSLPLALLARKR